MANSTATKAYGYPAAFTAGTECAPIVKHFYIATVDTAAAVDLETGLDGYYIPAGGAVIQGTLGAGTSKLTFNGIDLMTAATTTSPLISTVAAPCAPGTAAATAKLTYTPAGTITSGTIYVSVTLLPMATKAKRAGVGN